MNGGNKNQEPLSSRLKKLTKQDVLRRDIFGRTVLHVICIVGRFDLLKHLLKNTSLSISITDYESGWTALHCAIFYGRLSCARLLLDHKYDLIKVKDRNGLTAMDLYHLKYSYRDLMIFPQSIGKDDTKYIQRFEDIKDIKENLDKGLIWWDKDTRGGSDVYTYGINVNNQLGTGDAIDKIKAPYKVAIKNLRLDETSLPIADRLVKPRIKDIVLSKNHSVLLTNEVENNILIAGNPSRGRLGNASNTPNYHFKHMDYFADDHIVQVAVSDDHSLALTSTGEVYSWGLNNYYQLGFTTEKVKGKIDTFSEEPKKVSHALKKLHIEGISCSKIHSVAYTGKTLVLWGLNVGQMSFVSTGEVIKVGKMKGIPQVPRTVEFNHDIKQIVATDESTIVLLGNDECHVFTHSIHLRIQLPMYKTLNNEFEYFRPSKFSKKKQIIKLVSKNSTKIGILYNDGSVTSFGVDMFSKSSNIKYNNVWTPRNDHLKCVDVDIGNDGSIIICTQSGCVYKRISKTSSDYKFTKIEKIAKVTKVSCDPLFSSFGFIKDDVDQLPMELNKNKYYQDIAYLSPLSPSIENRKQLEIINADDSELYTVDFLHKPKSDAKEEELHKLFQKRFNLNDDDEKQIFRDPLLNRNRKRWDSLQPVSSTFLDLDHKKFLELLKKEDLKFHLNVNDHVSVKDYDLKLDVDDCLIGVHSTILQNIGKLNSLEEGPIEMYDGIKFESVSDGLVKVSGVHVHSILIVVHMLYTGDFYRPWESFGSTVPLLFKEVKTQTIQLMNGLSLVDDLLRPRDMFAAELKNIENYENDVIIKLKDGETLECCSFILKARNAYFETVFSDRWDGPKLVEYSHVEKEVFQIVLDYIYGTEQLQLFDRFVEIKSISEFINLQFELIELSDELLLFGLKDTCQLMIKDFIAQENVLLVLHHADILNCSKLVGQCLWYIYNNVDSFLTDPLYDELLSHQMITKIDSYCRWLNRVNKINPNDTKTSWYDGDSDNLLVQFLAGDREFDNIFLEGDNFVPLFDIPPKKEPTQKSPKLEPTKKSTAASPSPPLVSAEDRKKSISQSLRPVLPPSRKPSVSDSSAIEFTDDDFQPVINSRRRRSSASRRSTNSGLASLSPVVSQSIKTPVKSASITLTNQHIRSNISAPMKSSPIPINSPNTSLYSQRTTSVDYLNKGSWPGVGSCAGSSSASTWMTDTSASSIPQFPSFGENLAKTGSPSNTNTIIPGAKLSQKERKRMMKHELDVESKPKPENNSPWRTPSRNGSTSSIKSQSILAAQEEAFLAESMMPSLRGIIHQEEHRVFQTKKVFKPVEKKSMAEIQQEQEFAAWWEEESKKVQQQMNSFGINKSGNGFVNGKGKGNGNGNGKGNGNSNGKSQNKGQGKKHYQSKNRLKENQTNKLIT